MSKSISVKIPKEQDRQIRLCAAHLDINRSEFVRQAVEEKLARLSGDVNGVPPDKVARSIADVSEASATDRAGDTSSSERGEGATGEVITR
jgi:Arc/MetJ-type ribon-helix-helix transcriptional regulator